MPADATQGTADSPAQSPAVTTAKQHFFVLPCKSGRKFIIIVLCDTSTYINLLLCLRVAMLQ